MFLEDDSPPPVPEWAITFGDMMALLLTFFILLVSMSEVKKNDKFQGIADSIQHHFGYDDSNGNGILSESRPRSPEVAALAVTGRTKRQQLLNWPAKLETSPPTPVVSPGHALQDRRGNGLTLHFEQHADLTAKAYAELRALAGALRGKPQRIEIRGQVTAQPTALLASAQADWEIAFRRCRAAMQVLIEEGELDPSLLRIAVTEELADDSSEGGVMPAAVRVVLLDDVQADNAVQP